MHNSPQLDTSVVMKRSNSCRRGVEAVVDDFDGTFEVELAELAVPAAGT